MIGAIPIIAENRIREAMERGEFDHLKGAGRPLDDTDGCYDPNWWLKRKLRQEQFTSESATPIIKSTRQEARIHGRP
jgi:Domain of unknown function (DUF1992)